MQIKKRFVLLTVAIGCNFFIDQEHIATQYQTEIGADIFVDRQVKRKHSIDILVENMGRVNYGHKLLQILKEKASEQGSARTYTSC